MPARRGAAVIRLRRRLPGDSSDLTRGPAEPAVSSSYSVLLRVGFTEPAGLPAAGGLLPAPFHLRRRLRAAVSFLWHSPSGHPDRALPGTLLCGARTFLDGTIPARLPGGLGGYCTRGFGGGNPPDPGGRHPPLGRGPPGSGPPGHVDQPGRETP